MNERKYPHLVELLLPPGGFGSASDAMLAFHREHGIQPRRGRNEDEDFFVTFCFADPIHADAFQKRFGGALLTQGAAPGTKSPGGARHRRSAVEFEVEVCQPKKRKSPRDWPARDSSDCSIRGDPIERRRAAQLLMNV